MKDSNINAAMDETMAYEAVYPEIYYRVQPFIMSVCDQMEAYGGVMPSAEVIERIADNIYADVITMYPDMSEYIGGAVGSDARFRNDSSGYAQPVISPYYRRRFRRRGVFRDFVEILLLNEIFRRL